MAFPVRKLADSATLDVLVPIFIALIAGPVLGEPIGPVRWLAILIGFAGAIVARNPTRDVFEGVALIVVLSAFRYAVAQLMARLLAVSQPASVLAFDQTWSTSWRHPA